MKGWNKKRKFEEERISLHNPSEQAGCASSLNDPRFISYKMRSRKR
jgi:hypothetical protein